jgi:peptidoglycan/xylan/chitin deacetylase (PgdA/CDA1 family)
MRKAFDLTENFGILRLLDQFQPPPGDYVYLLNYHRVDEVGHRPWLNPNLISTSPRQFERQMQLVASRYHPVTLQQVLRAALGESPLPRRAVLVTVDDGYLDFKEHIFPIARQNGIQPVLFVSTAFVGTGKFWWDELYQLIYLSCLEEIKSPLGMLAARTSQEKDGAYQAFARFIRTTPFNPARRLLDELCQKVKFTQAPQRSTLDWEELRALGRAGVDIASHSHSHPLLSQVPLAQVKSEIQASLALIRNETGQGWPVLAYPDGKPESYSPAVISAVQKAGVKLAFTTNEGIAKLGSADPFQLPRIGIWQKTSQAVFHYHLTSFYRGK